MSNIAPFTCNVSDETLADLQRRLDATRWTDQLDGAGWDYGTERGFLQELCRYWREDFDWRKSEARFNAHPQFMTEINGENVHFYHARSPEPDAVPLIITHGYPGSVAEFLDIIGPLSDPASHGGDPKDAFHVVAPSIPGYGFSGPTRNKGFNIAAGGAVNVKLMEMLGYDRYFAQGGDWGSAISTNVATRVPDRVIGLHLNLIVGFPADPADPFAGLTEREKEEQAWKEEYNKHESAYQAIQGTKPQSLAYGLNDSPAGLAGWIVEKFKTWSDCGDDVTRSFTKDQLLENVMLYWITGTINSAMRMYYESMGPGRMSVSFEKCTVPTGYAHFPREIRPTPRVWADQIYTNIVRWTEMPAGGHFAAFEQPVSFVEELRTFARDFR
ncbi:MAG: epoxide hydrolase [Novosphingobium sp.]|nr:epoxide hydrolase [Novosphingobium sp.]